MKILFTNSPLHFTHGHTFTQPDCQTLVLPLLAGIVREHDIRLVDNMALKWRSNIIMDAIAAFSPDIVGFSIIASRDIQKTADVIRMVRARYPALFLIAGGQAGTFYDQALLQSGIDVVVRKEGEITLKELVAAVGSGKEDFSDIAGITYGKNSEVIRTAERPMLTHLDESPFPAFDLMPESKSRWFSRRLSGALEISRGCPHGCNFCAVTAFWEGSYRRKSIDRVIRELKFMCNMGRSHIYLTDDNFGMGERFHTELFERILSDGIDVRFFAQMRTDTVANHPAMMRMAAKAGLYGALIGFDTYETDTFHHVTKSGSVELNLKCAEVLRKNDIMIYGSHLYAPPSQKKPLDFAKTFWMGRRNSDLFRMPHFNLLPGTKAYGKMLTEEIIDDIEKNDDYQFLTRTGRERKRFKRWYMIFNFLNVLLPDEIWKALFHKNRNVRIQKRYGYIGMFRHYSYRVLRKIHLTDI